MGHLLIKISLSKLQTRKKLIRAKNFCFDSNVWKMMRIKIGHLTSSSWGVGGECFENSIPFNANQTCHIMCLFVSYISLYKCFTEHCFRKCWTVCTVQYFPFCWSNIDIPGSYCHNPTFPYHLKQKPNFLQFFPKIGLQNSLLIGHISHRVYWKVQGRRLVLSWQWMQKCTSIQTHHATYFHSTLSRGKFRIHIPWYNWLKLCASIMTVSKDQSGAWQ